MGEPEASTRELYRFFSQATHPNRNIIADRYLGQGNDFVLGSIGKPSLAMLADYALKTLDLWFWFGAFVAFVYMPLLAEADQNLIESYDTAAKKAASVSPWLVQQFNHVLAQEQAERRHSPSLPYDKRDILT